MKGNASNNPPRLADALLEMCYNTHEVEEIQGDLYELFERRIADYGPRKASQLYWRDVFRFLNPFKGKRKITPAFPSPDPSAMFRSYLKTAVRTVKGNKTYALLNVTGLALGLACGLLIFLFVQFHLGTDAFHPHAERIYRVVLDIHSEDGSIQHEPGVALAVPKALQKHFAPIRQTASLLYMPNLTLTIDRPGRGPESFSEPDAAAFADAGMLDLFSYTFIAGDKRTALGEPGTVVLSERQVRKYFNCLDVLGKTLRINHTTDVKVTGIFRDLPENTDLKAGVLLSLPTLKVLKPNYPLENLGAIGSAYFGFVELPEGYDYRSLQAQLPAFRQKYQGAGMSHWHYHLLPLRQMHFDERYGGYLRKPLLAALGLVGVFLVAIGCINFINMATAQSLRRLKEVGVRKAMGGTRRQLFWQFITEAACLTGVATLLALALTAGLLPRLGSWISTPLSLDVSANPLLLPFLGGLALAVTFLAGSYPALVLAGYNPILALKGKITTQNMGGLTLRRVLVGVQLVLSQAFIIGALVVMHQMAFFRHADPGFEREAILLLKAPITDKTPGQIREGMLGLAEVEGVSFQFQPPMFNSTDGGYVRFDARSSLSWCATGGPTLTTSTCTAWN
jgi:putative ABC transport system permease protein